MKKYFSILAISILVLVIGAGVVYATSDGRPTWLQEKDNFLAKHDQKVREWQSANTAVVIPKPDNTLLNAGASPLQKQGIYAAVDTQLPLSGMTQKEYNFTNVAYTPYNVIIAGSFVSDSSKGELIVITIDQKSGQETRNNFDFPNTGAITIVKIQGNNVVLRDSNGNQGTYDITKGNITWDQN